MSDKYRQLLTARAEIEIEFPRLKQWYVQQKMTLRNDTSLDQEDYDDALDQLEIMYQEQKIKRMERKNAIERDIADEIDRMNQTSAQAGRPAAYRADGRVDFGKAFVYLSDQIEILSKKIDALDRILVESE